MVDVTKKKDDFGIRWKMFRITGRVGQRETPGSCYRAAHDAIESAREKCKQFAASLCVL